MDSFRVNFTTSSSPGGNHLTLPSLTGPSPLSYSPNVALIHSTSPRTQFGTAHRFLPSKVGYISPRHNSDLLCTASPGPKYNVVPTAATFPRQPCLGWGDRNQLEQREKRQGMAAMAMQASDVGPAAYTPRVQSVKPAAPRCAFSRSDRFGGPFGSYQTLNNSLGNGGSTSTANWDTVLSSSPRYSFGGGGEKELRNGVLTDRIHARQKPRTSFMTHSIRGGLARPATLEVRIDFSQTCIRLLSSLLSCCLISQKRRVTKYV